MKNKKTETDQISERQKEESAAAAKRREDYAIARDLQAEKDNEAIAARLVKEQKKHGGEELVVQNEDEV
jgi:hypothetical protein